MKYKMITIDVDDTLLNDDAEVTPQTIEALRAAVDLGVIVTLATGRMFASAKQIAKRIELNVPLITYQGSLVKNLLDEEVLYERNIPVEVGAFLFKYAMNHEIHLQGYYNDELISPMENQWLREYASLSRVPYRIEPDLAVLAGKSHTKLVFIDDPKKLDLVARDLAGLVGDQVHITKSKPHFLEIVHKEATKGHAVRFLADYFGCSLEQVIAIGDSWNDREMIEVAGLGVAMGNAVPALKDVADFVTKSNNEDGVRYVIERFVL
ncbi:Cof-type HAD-IIB family hydrolase [Ammoniphilus resinae]|uniref:Cof subfamily protein (Haloacid dehalogenase superfamily) n=1 Tax=Ammoniphilus resinae TaxID=861532 RepID=A0ABS4GJE5_9BACL|nr:Cof-type HAD-IIB family hydrolase [Ammoniphilus resinae]MBP1930383.1 Cof subfamily protein (haloacid dehalogenase superfamily) [Ammoniphilus resinae]